MKKILFLIAVVSILFVCGCASKQETKTAPENSAEKIEFGNKEEVKVLLQMDINPSLIIGYAENEEVVYLASNNEDGYTFLEKHDAVKILGEPIHAAIGAIMTAAHEDGYEAEGFDVAINFVGEEKGDIGDIMQIMQQAVETCDFDITATVEQENEIVHSVENESIEEEISEQSNSEPGSSENPDSEPDSAETPVCNVCNGEGRVICENCNGAGETMITVQREKEVRNDYVCEICGGKGWIDDGMHGGEIANCDSCGGMEGKMGSADFRAKAYDLVMVDEEEMRRCETCDGDCEVTCPQCNGTGVLD